MRRLILAAVLLSFLLCQSTSPQHYPLAGVVSEIDRSADVVTVEDAAGNLWRFTGAEDWCLGDLAALLMDDGGTPENVMDDVIVAARYAGGLPSD